MHFRVKKYFKKQPLSYSQTPTKTQQNNLKEHIEEIIFFLLIKQLNLLNSRALKECRRPLVPVYQAISGKSLKASIDPIYFSPF